MQTIKTTLVTTMQKDKKNNAKYGSNGWNKRTTVKTYSKSRPLQLRDTNSAKFDEIFSNPAKTTRGEYVYEAVQIFLCYECMENSVLDQRGSMCTGAYLKW